jgi:hypothetical protein
MDGQVRSDLTSALRREKKRPDEVEVTLLNSARTFAGKVTYNEGT